MQPGSSRSEPRASTAIAFRKRSRSPGFTRTFTHIASIAPSFLLVAPNADVTRTLPMASSTETQSHVCATRDAIFGFGLIRAQHAQNVLADIGEDQVGGDRRGLVEAGFAPFALDVVFLGEREAAEGGERSLGGVP